MRLAECLSANEGPSSAWKTRRRGRDHLRTTEGLSSAWKTRGPRPFCRPNPLNLLRDPKLVTFTRDLLIYKASMVMPDLGRVPK